MQWVYVAAIVVVGVLVGIWYVANKFRPDLSTVTDHVETVDDGSRHDMVEIPLRKRVGAISTTGKVMFGSILVLFVYIAVVVFQTFRTGSPSEFLYTQYLVYAALVLAGAVAGVIGKAQAEKSHCYCHIKYEDADGDVKRTETLPVDVQAVGADSEGHPLVYEYKRGRVMGLFRQLKHVGEDQELQSTDRPSTKLIQHQIPDFATEIGEHRWVWRTQTRDPVKNPTVAADYIYTQPIEMEYSDYVDKREENRRLRIRNQGLQSRLSAITKEMNRLRRMVESGKHKEEQKIMDKVDEIFEMVTDVLHGSDGQFGGSDENLPPGPRGRVEIEGNSGDARQEARTDGGDES